MYLTPIYFCLTLQQRRLVINIGGAKIWVTNIGGHKFRENIFSDIFKNLKKILLFSEISDDLLLVIDNFKKLHPSFEIYSLFFVFFLFLSMCLLSFIFFSFK